MKFKIFIILLLLYSCTSHHTKKDNRKAYNTKGFAYIFNNEDYENKIIRGKLNNELMEVSHAQLNINTPIKIINPKTNESIILRNKKKIKYPEFYKILISQSAADKLNLDKNVPLVEVIEIKKNKSFVAQKAKIFNEEKKISTNAPVASVQVANISKNKAKKKKKTKDQFFILIASFSDINVTNFLKDRIAKEIPSYDMKKIKTIKKTDRKINLISGPYYTVNSIKNDYIQLKNFGFEELEINTYD